MYNISGLNDLYAITRGHPAIKIAVLDGKVDLAHTCFQRSGDLQDAGGLLPQALPGLALKHGTAVYSLIFGQHGTDVEGVAPGCSSIIIPIYAEDGNDNFSPASQIKLARAIQLAVDRGANIINISGGQFSKYGDSEFLLKQAIDNCEKSGVLIVAAAGNEGCNCLHIPAADRRVLAVGSMDNNGNPTTETNFGASYQTNGILAPGTNHVAALPGGGTFLTSGATSYATPVVSGLVGLLMSYQLINGQEPDAYVIKSILEATADPCPGDGAIECRRFLRGKLNLPAAMAAISKSTGILASASNPSLSTGKLIFPQCDEILSVMNEVEVIPADTTDIPTETTDPLAESLMNADTATESAVCTTENNSDELTADDPSLPLADAELAAEILQQPISPSSNTETNQIIKILNMQKMENNTKTPIAGTAATNEYITTLPGAGIAGAIEPSCACGGGSDTGEAGGNGDSNAAAAVTEPATLVYALGNLDYDFGGEAHRDSFAQSMGGNANDPAALIKYLKANPWAAEELIWTLNIDSTPIYAILPGGSYSPSGYERIRQYFEQQQNGNIQRISVPGVSHGATTLLNGYGVANLIPNLRGMYSWTTEALTAAATGTKGSARALAENVSNFLNRIYYQMRNLGTSPQERALNYAATNAYQVSSVFFAALKESLELNDIAAEKSPICRPGSDCYDVTLSFFNPKERLTVARREYRFTIDVSDVVPVTVGEVRAWSVY